MAQVLYLTEPIDEVAIQNLAEYDDKKFVDVSREGIDLGTDEQDTKKVRLLHTPVCPLPLRSLALEPLACLSAALCPNLSAAYHTTGNLEAGLAA